MIYRLLVTLVRVFMHLSFRIRVTGAEHIPTSGGVIICSNHIHNLDPALIAIYSKRPIRFMAKIEVFSWPVLGFLIKQVRAIPVRRGGADISAIRQCLATLRSGEMLGIFPEGTRSKTGELREPFQGVTMLADTANVLVVPVGISGEYKPFGILFLNFGAPFLVRELETGAEYSRERATEEIMKRIDNLRR